MRYNALLQKVKRVPKGMGLAAVIIIALIAFKLIATLISKQPALDIKVVEVAKVNLQDLKQTVRLIGTIYPKQKTVLVAKADGILDILVQSGRAVKKGTLVAKIDNKDSEDDYGLSLAESAIAKAQFERMNSLYKEGHVSKKSFEDRKAAWISSQRDKTKTKLDLKTTQFHAPFDGVIGVYKVREGTQVSVGDGIVNFYDPSSAVVEFGIPATVVMNIKDGQNINIDGKAYQLTHVQRIVDESTHMCPAYIDMTCNNCLLGTTVDLDLTVKEKRDVIVIPFEAVFSKKGQAFVYLVENDKVVLQPVKIGMQEKEYVEIAEGLKPGQSLILHGQDRLQPGLAVKIFAPVKTDVLK